MLKFLRTPSSAAHNRPLSPLFFNLSVRPHVEVLSAKCHLGCVGMKAGIIVSPGAVRVANELGPAFLSTAVGETHQPI